MKLVKELFYIFFCIENDEDILDICFDFGLFIFRRVFLNKVMFFLIIWFRVLEVILIYKINIICYSIDFIIIIKNYI